MNKVTDDSVNGKDYSQDFTPKDQKDLIKWIKIAGIGCLIVATIGICSSIFSKTMKEQALETLEQNRRNITSGAQSSVILFNQLKIQYEQTKGNIQQNGAIYKLLNDQNVEVPPFQFPEGWEEVVNFFEKRISYDINNKMFNISEILKKDCQIVVHHTAINTEKYNPQFNIIKDGHIKRGFGDIGYHWFVENDGQIIEGRPEYVQGAHTSAKEMNYKSLGIVLAGNFEEEDPTDYQKQSLIDLVNNISYRYGNQCTVTGHRDHAATVCPGGRLNQDFIDELNHIKPKEKQPEKDSKELISRAWEVTRYYTPTLDQKCYTHNPKGKNCELRGWSGKWAGWEPGFCPTNEADRKQAYECDRIINTQGDGLIGAMGEPVIAMKTVACDRSLMGKHLLIKGKEYYCNDTGGMITGNRIDMYIGVGDEAFKNALI